MSTMVIFSKTLSGLSNIIYILQAEVLCKEDYATLLSLNTSFHDKFPIIVDKLDGIALANDGRCVRFGEKQHIDLNIGKIISIVNFTWSGKDY